jgi:hypothetical protein
MRSDGAFDRVRVHLDPAVIEERDQAGPVAYRVAHGLRQIGRAGDPIDVIVQPIMQGLDDRPTSFLPDLSSAFR